VPLAEHFLGSEAGLSEDARATLLAHTWPGNVRELKNAIQRARLLCRDGVVQSSDLGLIARVPAPRPPADEPDRAAIEAALARSRGVISQAAAELGLSRQALYRRIEKYGIAVPDNGVELQKAQG